jgi:hypothetical protein
VGKPVDAFCTVLPSLAVASLKLGEFVSFVFRSSAGIATDYGLDDWMMEVRIPAGAGNFSLRHSVQTVSGAHVASYPMGYWGLFR